MKEIDACPVCGRLVMKHCYHEPQEEEVRAVKMPRIEAMKLRKKWCDGLLEEIENLIIKEDQTWIKDRVEKWLSELSPF